MSRPEDESHTDSAWRQIVENYGERARLDDEAPGPAVDDTPSDDAWPTSYATGAGVPDEDGVADVADAADDDVAEVDRFRPPDAPPVTLPAGWQRRAAWGGVFVAPVLAMLLALLRVQLPAVLGWGLVGWFVGGFGYLVATMPRTPREPWDDGSRV